MNDIAILENVTKIYGSRIILKNIEWHLHAGEVSLLVGENGSGKSTLLKIFAGLIAPSGGVLKKNPDLPIAYLGHDSFHYSGLTALENLRFWASLGGGKFHDSDLLAILKRLNLDKHAFDDVKNYSRGMLQRLNFARILSQRPGLLLLDEPFSGLDLPSKQLMSSEIAALRNEGAAIVLVSHDPDEDSRLADAIFEIRDKTLLVST